jgi:hypothetical protein
MKRLLVLFLLAAFFGPVDAAAPRTWNSSGGQFSTEADLLAFRDGKVRLKKTDGTVIDVPLERLSDADQQYVKARYPEAAAAGEKSDNREAVASADKVADKVADRAADRAGAAEADEDHAVQDVAMKLLRLDRPKRASRSKSVTLADYVLRMTLPQRVVQVGKSAANEAFRRVVKKEPKYVAAVPFRGVVTLGGHEFGFALDAVAPQAAGYDRLYFDAGGSGNLAKQRPLSATEVGNMMSDSQFPRVNVTLHIDGEAVEYAFLLTVRGVPSGEHSYAVASIYAAVAREGYVMLGTKRTKAVLVDHNSNGRFDDVAAVWPGGSLAEGDLLLLNPNPKKGLSGDGVGVDRNLVGKVLLLGKRFYRVAVAPSGSKLRLTPLPLSTGSVASAGPAFRAVLTSDDYGVVVVNGKTDEKIALPEGKWKLVSYTLDATAGGGRTALDATFGSSPPSLVVKKGETARLPFGKTYHAVVTAMRIEPAKVSLQLAVAGSGDERCQSLLVKGSRPPKPHFTIKDRNGKVVQEGDFEYG